MAALCHSHSTLQPRSANPPQQPYFKKKTKKKKNNTKTNRSFSAFYRYLKEPIHYSMKGNIVYMYTHIHVCMSVYRKLNINLHHANSLQLYSVTSLPLFSSSCSLLPATCSERRLFSFDCMAAHCGRFPLVNYVACRFFCLSFFLSVAYNPERSSRMCATSLSDPRLARETDWRSKTANLCVMFIMLVFNKVSSCEGI